MPALGQQMVTPDKVTAEPYLDMGNEKFMACGIHWANFILKGDRVLAYEIRILATALPETKQAITLAYGSLHSSPLVSGGPGGTFDTKPDDIFLFIEGDPESYKLLKPSSDYLPPYAYGGMVDARGDFNKGFAPAAAVLLRKPILVNYVFKRPDLKAGEETLIFKVVNTLPDDQDRALADCFQRMQKRLEKAG
jgi:hypothetical protein